MRWCYGRQKQNVKQQPQGNNICLRTQKWWSLFENIEQKLKRNEIEHNEPTRHSFESPVQIRTEAEKRQTIVKPLKANDYNLFFY